MTRPAVRMVALLLVAGLVVLPVLAACSVSWRDPTLKATRACTIVEMANNVTLKDVFIGENRSAVLADMIGLMQGNLSLLINSTYSDAAKAAAILEAEAQFAANDTATANQVYAGTWVNLSLRINSTYSDAAKAAAILEAEAQFAANDTATANQVYAGTWVNLSLRINSTYSDAAKAAAILEAEAQFAANDTATKAAAIKWASDSDTANSSVVIKAEVILWASDSDTANRTGAENTASLMALANRTGAANDAALAAAANRTLAANFSVMAQSLVVPSTGGATLYAPNESLGAVPVTYVGFPRGQWNASIAVGMPTAWTGGPLTAAFYWTADSSEGTVEWDFAGRCTGIDNQTIDSYLGANTTVLDTMGTKDNVYISDATAGTTMAGTPAGGAYCLLNFRRLSGAGTLISEAKLLGVRIYYPVV